MVFVSLFLLNPNKILTCIQANYHVHSHSTPPISIDTHHIIHSSHPSSPSSSAWASATGRRSQITLASLYREWLGETWRRGPGRWHACRSVLRGRSGGGNAISRTHTVDRTTWSGRCSQKFLHAAPEGIKQSTLVWDPAGMCHLSFWIYQRR